MILLPAGVFTEELFREVSVTKSQTIFWARRLLEKETGQRTGKSMLSWQPGVCWVSVQAESERTVFVLSVHVDHIFVSRRCHRPVLKGA